MTCAHCQAPLEGRSDAVYCTPKCRLADWRASQPRVAHECPYCAAPLARKRRSCTDKLCVTKAQIAKLNELIAEIEG